MLSIMTELCALTALAGATGLPADDPAVWLERMAHAVENLSYEGTFVHTPDDDIEQMRIVHEVVDGKVYEKLTAVGNGREIVRNDDEVRCTIDGGEPIVVDRYESPLRASLPAHREDLHEYYRFETLGTEQVAGRQARIIQVLPRDGYRYGHKLWLDEATAMPLRSALVDFSRNVIEQVMFVTIDIKESDASAPAPATQVPAMASAAPAEVKAGAWQADELPAGFQLTVARTNSAGEIAQEHYVYTDGLATVSVFVERADDQAEPLTAVSTLGSAHAYVTTVDGYQITAVGEVPPSTVEMIGASLRRKQ